MFSWMRTLCRRISPRSLAVLAVLNIIGSSIGVAVADTVYQPAEARYYSRRADLYMYVVSALLVSVWSIYGLFVIAKSNRKGIKIYFNVLMFLAVISMLVGAIHLILLFTLYRVNLVRSCVDDHMLGQFWWSLGFDRDDEIERAIVQCGKAWSRLSLQRAVVWGIYGFTLMTMVVLVYRHYRHLDNQWRLRIGDGDNDDSFDHETLTDHRLAPDEKMPVAQHEDCEKPKQDDFGTIQYQRRQRLYDEIQNQRTHGGRRQSRQQSQIPIHPLDPPPLGSAAQRAAEKMDYDFYREHLKHHIRQSPSPMDQDLSTDGATSRRRPTSWTVRNEYHHPPAAPQCAMQEDEDDEEIYRPPSPPGPLRGEEQDTGDEKRNMAEKD